MSECLVYLISNEKKTNLNHNETNIGRLSSNLISISDPTISKNHATIHMADNRFYLRDLGTVNGTYLNGNRLESNTKYPLKHKDTIQFGKRNTKFKCRCSLVQFLSNAAQGVKARKNQFKGLLF